MADIRLNKTELKTQKNLLAQLTKYLPTLILKKQQLQAEVDNTRSMEQAILTGIEKSKKHMEPWVALLSQKVTINIYEMVEIAEVLTDTENIAGVDVPVLREVRFKPFNLSYYIDPVWMDRAMEELRDLVIERERLRLVRERFRLLSKELRLTSIKVNLFEKRMIPQCKENIRKIKIFLGDQEVAAICNAKIAKGKLEKQKATDVAGAAS